MAQQNAMVRPGIVQDSMSDLLGTSLSNLPHWPRIHVLDRARYPRPFMKDKLQPLPNPFGNNRKEIDENDKFDIAETTNPSLRVQYLERSIDFLRRQHQELLTNLHDEVDRLKKENKELNFRLAMVQQTLPSGAIDFSENFTSNFMTGLSSAPESTTKGKTTTVSLENNKSGDVLSQEEKVQQLKILFLEAEVREMRKTLRDEQAENERLTRMLEHLSMERVAPVPMMQQRAMPDEKDSMAKQANAVTHSMPAGTHALHHQFPHPHPPVEPAETVSAALPFGATVNPLLVHLSPHPPRPPTLRECEVIIKHLQQLNDRQSHELSQIKTDLRDVLYSEKWTPDAFLLAKAYVVDDEARELAERDKLPRVQLKQQGKKIPDSAYGQKDGVMLPAMKASLSSKVAERRKRTQILQRARYTEHEVLH